MKKTKEPRRDVPLKGHFTPAEAAKVYKAAAKEHRTVSDWLRLLVLGKLQGGK